ncbi:MAG: hypothetical protein WBD29_14725 [Candidatus Competibacter sp.]
MKKFIVFSILFLITTIKSYGATEAPISPSDSGKKTSATSEEVSKAVSPNENLKSVISVGLGNDVPSAAQNAAQNALTNVVGSFIDSTKMLEKRVEIEQGVRSQTSRIDTNIKEYAQGSIQSFEVIEVKNEAGLTKVTAKISVRIEDFKAFIKKLAEGQANVEAGLFSSLSTESSQKKNLEKIVIDLINPVVRGEVSKFEVGKPNNLEGAREEISKRFIASYKMENYAAQTIENGKKELLTSLDKFVAENHPRLGVYIPITVILDPSFYANALKTLENVAGDKHKYQIGKQFETYGYMANVDMVLGLGEIKGGLIDGDMYLLKGIDSLIKKEFYWMGYLDKAFEGSVRGLTIPDGNKKAAIPRLNIDVLDSADQIINSYSIESNLGVRTKRPVVEKNFIIVPDFIFEGPPWNLLVSIPSQTGTPMIVKKREFGILILVDDVTLKNAKEIKVKLLPN